MGEKWRPNVAYGPAGTRVEYEGTVYELIQPHTSQMGWEPTQTPALWRVARDQGHHSSHHDDHHSSHHDDHKHSSHHDDHHHSSHHDDHKHEEKPQQQAQSQQQAQPQQQQFQQQQNQVNAQANTKAYEWVQYTGSMPGNALAISNKLGKTFCVARGSVQNGIHGGYCDPAKNRMYTSFGGKEVVCEKFEVLVADPNRVFWARTTNTNNPDNNFVECGHEADGTPTYIIKADRDGVPYFGKTYKGASCGYYGFDDKEFKVQNFEILSFRN